MLTKDTTRCRSCGDPAPGLCGLCRELEGLAADLASTARHKPGPRTVLPTCHHGVTDPARHCLPCRLDRAFGPRPQVAA